MIETTGQRSRRDDQADTEMHFRVDTAHGCGTCDPPTRRAHLPRSRRRRNRRPQNPVAAPLRGKSAPLGKSRVSTKPGQPELVAVSTTRSQRTHPKTHKNLQTKAERSPSAHRYNRRRYRSPPASTAPGRVGVPVPKFTKRVFRPDSPLYINRRLIRHSSVSCWTSGTRPTPDQRAGLSVSSALRTRCRC